MCKQYKPSPGQGLTSFSSSFLITSSVRVIDGIKKTRNRPKVTYKCVLCGLNGLITDITGFNSIPINVVINNDDRVIEVIKKECLQIFYSCSSIP